MAQKCPSGILVNTMLPAGIRVSNSPYRDGFFAFEHDRSPIHTCRTKSSYK